MFSEKNVCVWTRRSPNNPTVFPRALGVSRTCPVCLDGLNKRGEREFSHGRPGTASALMNGVVRSKLPAGEQQSDSTVQCCHRDHVWNRSRHEQPSLSQMVNIIANILLDGTQSELSEWYLEAFQWNLLAYYNFDHHGTLICGNYLLLVLSLFLISLCLSDVVICLWHVFIAVFLG